MFERAGFIAVQNVHAPLAYNRPGIISPDHCRFIINAYQRDAIGHYLRVGTQFGDGLDQLQSDLRRQHQPAVYDDHHQRLLSLHGAFTGVVSIAELHARAALIRPPS